MRGVPREESVCRKLNRTRIAFVAANLENELFEVSLALGRPRQHTFPHGSDSGCGGAKHGRGTVSKEYSETKRTSALTQIIGSEYLFYIIMTKDLIKKKYQLELPYSSELALIYQADLMDKQQNKQQPSKYMKNIKLNLKKTATAGFSLVEMLVVIAVIGVIAAIAIPNIGSINNSAKAATAQRNAQSVASVLNAAAAAGGNLGPTSTGAAAVQLAESGITIVGGAFSGKKFTSGPIDDEDQAAVESHLTIDTVNNQAIYNPNP